MASSEHALASGKRAQGPRDKELGTSTAKPTKPQPNPTTQLEAL